MRVAPVFGVLRIAVPGIGDAHAAGEADAAVDHQQLAVRAVVHAREVVPAQRMVEANLDAGGFHLLHQFVIELLATRPVDQNLHRYAGARAFLERLRELLAHAAGPVDVGLEGDAMLRAADRREHLREDLRAIFQVAHAVAIDDRRAEHDAQLAQKLRVAHRVAVRERALDLLFRADEVKRQHRRQHRGEGADQRGDEQPSPAPGHGLGSPKEGADAVRARPVACTSRALLLRVVLVVHFLARGVGGGLRRVSGLRRLFLHLGTGLMARGGGFVGGLRRGRVGGFGGGVGGVGNGVAGVGGGLAGVGSGGIGGRGGGVGLRLGGFGLLLVARGGIAGRQGRGNGERDQDLGNIVHVRASLRGVDTRRPFRGRRFDPTLMRRP